MLTKGSVVLFGLVVGLVSISAPATAQDDTAIMFHRVCTVAPGQAQGAVAFAREITDYFDEKWPETQMFSFRPAMLPNNEIHFVTQYANMEAYGAFRPVLIQDSGLQALILKSQSVFVPDNCRDDLSVVLR